MFYYEICTLTERIGLKGASVVVIVSDFVNYAYGIEMEKFTFINKTFHLKYIKREFSNRF